MYLRSKKERDMNFESLVQNINAVHETLQAQAAHAVNLALTARNWLIGYYIVEFEQHGEDRAAYGEKLLKKLESRIIGKGMNERRFRDFRRLYLTYPQLAVPVVSYVANNSEIRRLLTAESFDSIRRLATAEFTEETQSADTQAISIPADRLFGRLSSTHLIIIAAIKDPLKRAFYEIEAINGCWTTDELDRQINSLYFERSGMSKNKEALAALVNKQAVKLKPTDMLHDPVALEFLETEKKSTWTEKDLEDAIVGHLQEFLLEMGNGFCFEFRQKRILIDSDYFKADLIFYHRILKCHVIIDVKIDRFRHEYASQMNTYLNYYKYEVMQPGDNPPVGILLCTGKGDTLVKYATAGLDQNIFVQKYMVSLPSVDDLTTYVADETKKEILRLSAPKQEDSAEEK